MQRYTLALALVVGLVAAVSSAQTRFGIDAGLGYALLDFDGTEAEQLERAESWHASAGVSWSPFDEPGLKLGATFLSSGYYETDELEGIPLESDFDEDFEELFLYMIEGRIGWYQPLGDHFFIEPGVGAGVLIGRIAIGQQDDSDEWDRDYTERDTDANFAVRPILAAGVRWGGHYMLGLETSYLISSLDFDEDLGGDIREWRTNVMFRFVF